MTRFPNYKPEGVIPATLLLTAPALVAESARQRAAAAA